jgi:hypothetical protein
MESKPLTYDELIAKETARIRKFEAQGQSCDESFIAMLREGLAVAIAAGPENGKQAWKEWNKNRTSKNKLQGKKDKPMWLILQDVQCKVVANRLALMNGDEVAAAKSLEITLEKFRFFLHRQRAWEEERNRFKTIQKNKMELALAAKTLGVRHDVRLA